MKTREGWKEILVDSSFTIQTVSEWVFQQAIIQSSCLLLSWNVNENGSKGVQRAGVFKDIKQWDPKLAQ